MIPQLLRFAVCFALFAIAVQAQTGLQDFVASTFTPGMMATFSLGVLYDHTTVQTPSWGSGAVGLEKRAEWRMAGLLTRGSVEYGLARFRKVSTAYVRCRCKGFLPRSRHALVSEFTELRSDGSHAPPVSRFAGMAAGLALVSVAQHANAGTVGQRSLLLVESDIGFNMLTEFRPEMKRALLRRR